MPVTSKSVHANAPIAYEFATYYVGTVSANRTGVVRFTLPRDVVFHELQVGASGASGTSPTLNASAKVGATTLVTTGNLTGAGVVRANPTTKRTVKAGNTITVDLTVGGTSPSFSDVVVNVVLRTAGPDFVGGTSL